MARINRGSCVGILYLDAQGRPQVHNGRLLRARYGNTWVPYVETTRRPNAVEFRHWNIRRPANTPFLETRVVTRVREVRRTPDLTPDSPRYCANFRGIMPGNRILPGTCVGVWFREQGVTDVKNGRYLYWRDRNGRPHCVITPGVIPYEVFYYHFIIGTNPQTGQPELVPMIISRTGVRGVFRTTL
ncbi:MAG TPA: hypothetical protein VK464_22640 [Symbiobacteriaceae bacterium]|jgi:hypothetical protein|nr:hypothetical protein [Symbiobacteriaceae bacterium]